MSKSLPLQSIEPPAQLPDGIAGVAVRELMGMTALVRRKAQVFCDVFRPNG